jgi:SpoIVB peptidase S55
VLLRTSLFTLTLAAALASRALAAAVPTLAPDQLRPGQKAVVKTVFQGDRIEEFEAEIVGVLRGGRAEGDMILARATSERVVKSGVAQGMSGSPVYVDGKLVGALSSGWSFSREPLFGVTPIGEMLRVLDAPLTGRSSPSAGPSGVEAAGRATDISFASLRWDDPPPVGTLPPGAETAGAAEAQGLARLALPLSSAGLHPGAVEAARRAFEPLGFRMVPGGAGAAAASGGAASATAAGLEPGAAVAVDLVRGDLQVSAIGTVTWRDGDQVLIFGHPLFQSGEVRLPLSTATITTVVASQLTSFKLGSSGQPIGMLTQDRRAAMAGRIGQPPRMMPLAVGVTGAGGARQAFRFESIEDRTLAPQIVAVAALNSLLESGGTGANQSVRWTMRIHRRGAAPLKLSDVVVSESPASDLVGELAAPLRFLANNPFQRLALDSVLVDLEVEPARDLWALRNARVLGAAVRPGGRVRVECEVERWRGERRRLTVPLQVPQEVPSGRYLLWVGGGAELARYESARRPGRYRPTSLDDAWTRLADYRATDRLYAALFAAAPEVTRDGRDYPELPTSALALLAGSQSAGDDARRGDRTILDEARLELGGRLRGELQLEVQVDEKAP